MVMVADLLPGLKRFLSPLELNDQARQMVQRMIIAFIIHRGRMSCSQAAGTLWTETRHRAQVSRFLARPRWRAQGLNEQLRERLLHREAARKGVFLFIVDATLCGQQGKKTQNTYSTGNRKRRSRKGRRHGKKKYARKSCHSFTVGLLITPSGLRIPFQRPYRTREYCKKKRLPHRTTAESAAELIRDLPLTTMLYLEWYRSQQLQRRGISEQERRWWRQQRTHGLCQAVRLASEENELKYMAERLKTDGGIRKLKRIIRNSFPREYRAAG